LPQGDSRGLLYVTWAREKKKKGGGSRPCLPDKGRRKKKSFQLTDKRGNEEEREKAP